MAKSSDLLPEDICTFFYEEENVQKHASPSCMEETSFSECAQTED